jgi:GNAT superfamily N-acetyltransferase
VVVINDPDLGSEFGIGPPISIIRATPEQCDLVSSVISDAFHDLAINQWIVPDPGQRRVVDPRRLGLVIGEALKVGAAYATPDFTAAAVWLPCPRPALSGSDEVERQLLAICGDCAPRCLSLERAMAAHHPNRPHCHLALLGVLPDRQGKGLGSAMLSHVHATLDKERKPAYLEAASPRSTQFYRRHGYKARGEPFPIGPGGPLMYPMWRDPQ